MGTSIFLIFIIPATVISAIFESVFLFFTGMPVTEISLPYNPESGLVWECEAFDYHDLELKETEIKENEQIFTFACVQESFGKTFDDLFGVLYGKKDEYQGDVLEIDFTAKNGDKKNYYAWTDSRSAPEFIPAEKCLTVAFTVSAKEAVEGTSWEVNALNSKNILRQKTTADSAETFTVVAPENYNDGKELCIELTYSKSLGKYERWHVYFDVTDGKLVETTRLYADQTSDTFEAEPAA